MWAIALTFLKPVWAFLKAIPWYIWVALVSVIVAWWLISSAIEAAELRGETKVHLEWDAANAKAAIDAANERGKRDKEHAATVAAIETSKSLEIVKWQTEAKTKGEQLRALIRKKPLDPSCVLDTSRVSWANSLITGTETPAPDG